MMVVLPLLLGPIRTLCGLNCMSAELAPRKPSIFSLATRMASSRFSNQMMVLLPRRGRSNIC